jgi:septal ring factor EnvC (AmiA/AmiB activator)
VTILLRTRSFTLTLFRDPPMRLLLFPLLAIAMASCMNPRAEANMAQALNDAANEIGGLKSDIAQIQTDLDSLRSVVAKQDTIINRIAAANNIPR